MPYFISTINNFFKNPVYTKPDFLCPVQVQIKTFEKRFNNNAGLISNCTCEIT
jgi:hypothetical protein